MAEVLGKLLLTDIPSVNGVDMLLGGSGIISILADITANRPTAGVAGRLFLDTSTNRFYRDDGTSWIDLTGVPLIDGTTNQIDVATGTNVTPSVISIANNPVLSGTASFRPPVGSTFQRPVSPIIGDTRFNNTLLKGEEFNGSNWQPLGGTVLQYVSGIIPAASGTSTVPLDNTIPSNTEGWQIFSQAFTPISASSKIQIAFNITTSSSSTGGSVILSLFAGSVNLVSTVARINVSNAGYQLCVSEVYSPGSTAAITFSARLGGSTASTSYCNQVGTTTLGGAMVSAFTITEIQ